MNALAARFNAIFGADMAGPFAALAAVLVVFGLASPQFLTGATFGSVAFQLPELGILTLAMLLPILTGGLNLAITFTANMAGLTLQRRPDGSLGYTRDEFWRIAAEYPVRAIVGCDAHAPSELDVVPAIEEKKAFLHSLGIPVLDTLPGLE